MFGFFRKKISSNQVDLYVSDKILGVAKKVVAIVEANGVTIVDGPMKGLLSRAVLVTDENNKILYTEQVPEITTEPNYQAALDVLK